MNEWADDFDLFVLHEVHGTSWFGPYASLEDARHHQYQIRTHGDSMGFRPRTVIGRARYTSSGIEFARLDGRRRKR